MGILNRRIHTYIVGVLGAPTENKSEKSHPPTLWEPDECPRIVF